MTAARSILASPLVRVRSVAGASIALVPIVLVPIVLISMAGCSLFGSGGKKAPNKHALGEWDAAALDPSLRVPAHKLPRYDASSFRIHIGGGMLGTAFAHDLDLGSGNYDLYLAPHGGPGYGTRLGLDLGRYVSITAQGSYTRTSYFEAGDDAFVWTGVASLMGRYGGFFHDRWEVYGEAGGGVMVLRKGVNYIGQDTDGLMQAGIGTRWVGDWFIPRVQASMLMADGFARGSSSFSWQVMVSLSVPVFAW